MSLGRNWSLEGSVCEWVWVVFISGRCIKFLWIGVMIGYGGSVVDGVGMMIFWFELEGACTGLVGLVRGGNGF